MVCTLLGAALATVEGKLIMEIAQLATTVDRAIHLIPSASVEGSPEPQIWRPGVATSAQPGTARNKGTGGWHVLLTLLREEL
jgi:hypothetical protein